MDDRTASLDAPSDTDARTRELRTEIERTRGELAETVDAIQEKLRPGNIAASAASTVKDKMKDMAATTTEKVSALASSATETAGELAATTTERAKDMAHRAAETAEDWWESSWRNDSFVDRIKNNPVPAVLAGVGLAWLAFGGNRSRQRPQSSEEYPRPSEAYGGSGSYRPARTPRFGAAGTRRALDSTRETLHDGRERVGTMMRDYPLAVGAAALIVGASLGMAVPETDRENELMGEARDNAIGRAREAATGAVERVKDVAADVVTRATVGE
jgi:hypothetical protein